MSTSTPVTHDLQFSTAQVGITVDRLTGRVFNRLAPIRTNEWKNVVWQNPALKLLK
jgi:hypothetical protein